MPASCQKCTRHRNLDIHPSAGQLGSDPEASSGTRLADLDAEVGWCLHESLPSPAAPCRPSPGVMPTPYPSGLPRQDARGSPSTLPGGPAIAGSNTPLAEMFPSQPYPEGAHRLHLSDISFSHRFSFGVFLQHVPGSFLGAADLLPVSPSPGFGNAVLRYSFHTKFLIAQSGPCNRHLQE